MIGRFKKSLEKSILTEVENYEKAFRAHRRTGGATITGNPDVETRDGFERESPKECPKNTTSAGGTSKWKKR